MIAKAIEGSVPAYAFLLKMLLTALTLAQDIKAARSCQPFLQERHLDACLDMFLEFRRLFVRQQECLPCSVA